MSDSTRPDRTRYSRSPRSRISIQQVADRVGVAPSSVSRVLSGHPNVSEVMRNRVADAVAALGYEPDLLAQSLRRGASRTVGFVVGDISNPLLSEITLGAEIGLRRSGYTMLLANSMDDPDLDATHIRLFSQRRVDGLLLSLSDENSEPTLDALARARLPCVLVDREIASVDHASAVVTDHEAGMTAAVDHLVALGHSRIALVNGNPRVLPARRRAAILRRCARRFGVNAAVRSGSFTATHGEESMDALLDERDPPTAVIAGSNQIVVGVLRSLRRRGCSVPDDISLVTCDHLALSEFVDPPLATIERDLLQMGSVAANLFLELLGGAKPRHVSLPTTFRESRSCAPPRVSAEMPRHG
ncbi:MAG TPA: LacI family DNA-binding transcriptional regulator [Acidimicrobiales bacterium]|nr:LacI family DNA-binding transcriptional regulator [Acidimicrobiales bacterium]